MWYAYIVGYGEGCSYTVGCNERLIAFDVETYEEALAGFLKEFDLDSLGSETAAHLIENEWKSLEFFQVARIVPFDLQAAYIDYRQKATKKLKEEIEKAERWEYERLKKKYE